MKQALIRQKQIKGDANCLTCGEAEAERVSFDFIPKLDTSGTKMGSTGWYCRTALQGSMHTTLKRPATSQGRY